ncbi:MAG: nucleotidyltransferase domain-containing protein [Nanoarchaeota archaeon]
MAKKSKKTGHPETISLPQMPGTLPPLPKEAQEKLKAIKEKLEKFKKKVLDKFGKYVMGIALMPPPRPKEGEKPDIKTISVLVLVDDSDSRKMSKAELKQRLTTISNDYAKEIDPDLKPSVLIISELWQNCFDGKSEMLQLISMSAPVHDTGMLSAVKIAEIHKNMVLKKFEKYIVSYVLAGSLVKGKATPTSDIDVWIVIDDTDVKKMTRIELKDKLRAIIIGMGIEAGEITRIRNKLNIQVYILTDFWDSLKEANPVIFTLLRDGIPFFDRGMFMPWKQLLLMGKIKPSNEAIDMFMNSGEQMIKRVQFKLREIGMGDIFYALLSPSQAALMLHGVPPPSPRETPKLMRELFVQKMNLFEEPNVKILERVIQIRKEIEHGTKKGLTGKEVDKLLTDAEHYLKAIKVLFAKLEKEKTEEDVVGIYEQTVTTVRDLLRIEGITKVEDVDLPKMFNSHLIIQGKIPAKHLRILRAIIKAKKDYDTKKLTKAEIEKVRKDAKELTKALLEFTQRSRGAELERTRIRIKHGNQFGEVYLFDTIAFILHDLDAEEKRVTKAEIAADGSLKKRSKSTLAEFEKHLAEAKIPPKVFIKEPIFEDLRNIFGKDVEILLQS